MKGIQRFLRRFGIMLVPVPPSAKMLHEHANVSEVHHPSRGGNTVLWMRLVAKLVHDTDPEPCNRRYCEDCPK